MTISLVNLGCKVNQYELQSIKTALTARGHAVYEGLILADVYILNTCAVTNTAERKSGQFVAKAFKKNPNARIVVVGCASERNKDHFLSKGASYVSGSFDKSSIADIVDNFGKERTSGAPRDKNPGTQNALDNSGKERSSEVSGERIIEIRNANKNKESPEKTDEPDVREFVSEKKNNGDEKRGGYYETAFASTGKSRQFIKIQDGCDNFCSYCIIPHLRGRSRSRRENDIIEEIRNVRLKEIVLIGINLSAYGEDAGTSLTDILGRVRAVRPDLRVRLGSLEANVVDGEFLSEAATAENFCPHFHLSLQSGDDGVLRDMNRRYNTRDFLEKILSIRERFPDAAITTDIIVGFPTESAEAFENTLRFAEEAGFADVHIFPYSARGGTAAARLKSAVSGGGIKTRVKRLTELKSVLKERYIQKFCGKTLNVLIEEIKDGEASGYSENYIRVYTNNAGDARVVENAGNPIAENDFKVGSVYGLKIDGIYKDGAKGSFCKNAAEKQTHTIT
jgi:threonylcarbamoyladenosine tRNA methylthiotransferase MtaB